MTLGSEVKFKYLQCNKVCFDYDEGSPGSVCSFMRFE